jgi:hypothetical protein
VSNYVLKDHLIEKLDDDQWYLYERNPADYPERYGLEVVGSAEEPALSYEFNTFVVWKDADGTFYTASDSGCPIPFEGHTELEEVLTLQDLQVRLHEWSHLYPDNDYQSAWDVECQDLLKTAQAAGLKVTS